MWFEIRFRYTVQNLAFDVGIAVAVVSNVHSPTVARRTSALRKQVHFELPIFTLGDCSRLFVVRPLIWSFFCSISPALTESRLLLRVGRSITSLEREVPAFIHYSRRRSEAYRAAVSSSHSAQGLKSDTTNKSWAVAWAI